jgi:glycosyltransferase involved in cell wall biosynthesis
MNPLVSIIIPCHNAAPWLAQTLESALAQTWPKKEIILVDDGSTDDSRAIARTFEPRGVRVLSQSNLGASVARNTGLRAACGDFIQFLDADDLLTAEKVAQQVALLERRGLEHVASCRWGRFEDGLLNARYVDDAVFRDFTPTDFLLLHTRENRMMHPAAWLVPSGVTKRAGPWNETLSLNDDGEYFARVVLTSHGIVYSAEGASIYRSQLPNSLSNRRSRRALESLALSVKLVAHHMLDAEDSPRVRQALADYWQRLAYSVYPEAPDLYRQAVLNVKALGGSSLKLEMGKRQRLFARLVGWKLTRRVQRRFST